MTSSTVVNGVSGGTVESALRDEQPLGLFDIPPELRLYVYHYLYATLASSGTEQEIMHTTALLRTNLQVLSEAGPSFLCYKTELSKRLRMRYREKVSILEELKWDDEAVRKRAFRRARKEVNAESSRMERIVARVRAQRDRYERWWTVDW